MAEDFATEGGGALAIRPGAFYENSSDLCALEDEMAPLAERYGQLKLPVSILFAEEDQLLDPDRHGVATADQIPGARLKLVPGGHMLPFTQPDVTAQWLREELAEQNRTPARE